VAVDLIEVTTDITDVEVVEVFTPGVQGPAGPGGGGGGGGDFQFQADPMWTPAGTGPNTAGALRLRSDGKLFLCSASGTPGEWWEISGFTLTDLGEVWMYGALGAAPFGGTGFGGIGG
jgi:hypothetical protein